jgi:Tfp pilus assembly protein PilN
MSKSINLLVPEYENAGWKRKVQLLRLLSLSVMLGVIVVSAGLFFLIISSPLPALRREESTAEDRLRSLQTKSGQIFLIRERLGDIATILDNRPLFDVLLERVTAELPTGVTIDAIETNADAFSITVSATSLSPINTFIENILVLKEDALFRSVTLSEVSFDEEDPRYRVTLSSLLSL